MYTTLISAAQLQSLMASGQPLMVFDCSFELMQPGAGDAQYQECHIAGAVRADLDRHLSAHGAPDAASGGRHPLPSRESLAGWLGSVGLTPGMQAVVYDRQGANYCGRLWWLLKWVGHEAAAVLDGGLQAWTMAGGTVESGTGQARPAGTYPLSSPRTVLASYRHGAQPSGAARPDGAGCARRAALQGRGRAARPGGRSHSRRAQPPVRRQPGRQRILQERRRFES